MHDDERHEESAERSPVFRVAPVRSGHALPREVLLAIVVGVLAFLAGIQVAAVGTTDRGGPSVLTPTPLATASSIPATPQPVAAPPGSSAFVRGFQPAALIAGLPGGTGCLTSSRQKEVPRTLRDGPRLTFLRSWTTFCPVPAERRQSFLLAVIEGLVREVPAETYGYSASTRGSGDALFPYTERPLAGTVALAADAAGPGFEIVIILQEWRAE